MGSLRPLSSPLISLVLATKDAMPQVQETMEAVARQNYKNFEVIIQDGASVDGTLEYLRSLQDRPRIDIASEPDSGIGQAYNRGLLRARGEIVCFLAADERLDDDALERGSRWFAEHPDALAIYGGMRLVDARRRVIQTFIPPSFDWLKILHCETVVPMAATFLSRRHLGADLYYDESLKTCPDYDFWVRVGSKFEASRFVRVPEPILTARADRTSMSFRTESFPQFTSDKRLVLDRYLNSLGNECTIESLRSSATAGIFAWAAEQVLWLDGASPEFLRWCREAARFDPHCPRLSHLATRSEAFEVTASGQFVLKPAPQPEMPVGPTKSKDGILDLQHTRAEPWWKGAEVAYGPFLRVTTVSEPWGYSAVLPLSSMCYSDPDSWRWIKMTVRVLSGQVGISLFACDNIYNEKLLSQQDELTDVFVRVNQPGATGVMVRTGPCGGPAVVEIVSATVECAPAQRDRKL